MFKCLLCLISLNVAYCRPWNFKDVHFDDLGSPEFLSEGGNRYAILKHSENAKFGNKGYVDFLGFGAGGEGRYANDAHEGKYQDEGGVKKIKFDKDGHYLVYNKGGNGEKGLVYEESGSYSKGHKTVGSHVIHKLDELKKDTDFYDENHADGRKVRYGGYHKEEKGKAGDLKNRGNSNVGYRVSTFGKNGRFSGGSHFYDDVGHKQDFGRRNYFLNEGNMDAKSGEEILKNWKLSD